VGFGANAGGIENNTAFCIGANNKTAQGSRRDAWTIVKKRQFSQGIMRLELIQDMFGKQVRHQTIRLHPNIDVQFD